MKKGTKKRYKWVPVPIETWKRWDNEFYYSSGNHMQPDDVINMVENEMER